MRTTVILDDDVSAAVDLLRREQGFGLSEALNDLARRGLASVPKRRPPFRQRTQRLGLRVDVSNVERAIELLDGLSHR